MVSMVRRYLEVGLMLDILSSNTLAGKPIRDGSFLHAPE
jgi:hypothetical protein